MNTIILAAESSSQNPIPSTIGAIIGYVLVGIFLGKVFAKAGEESWKAWVPFLRAHKPCVQASFL